MHKQTVFETKLACPNDSKHSVVLHRWNRGNHKFLYKVYCDNCQGKMTIKDPWYVSKELAIKAWNEK